MTKSGIAQYAKEMDISARGAKKISVTRCILMKKESINLYVDTITKENYQIPNFGLRPTTGAVSASIATIAHMPEGKIFLNKL